jgi:hypothetical protein
VHDVQIKFNADIVKNDEGLEFNCKVEYPICLEPFIPDALKEVDSRNGASISPFSDGHGSFVSQDLEQAESVEQEIRDTLQAAYEEYLEWEQRLNSWDGTRVYELLKRNKKEVWSLRGR